MAFARVEWKMICHLPARVTMFEFSGMYDGTFSGRAMSYSRSLFPIRPVLAMSSILDKTLVTAFNLKCFGCVAVVAFQT